MKNKDILAQERAEIYQKINEAVKAGDDEGFAKAFADFAQGVQEEILAEARTLADQTDANILAARGVRQLTQEETKYYQKVIDAMRTSNPKQALGDMTDVLPKTTIDAVFEDLTVNHPLLDAINFQNTNALIEMLVNTNGTELASWTPLTAEITKELSSGFKKVNLSLNKLSAFLPVAKAMLDLGPAWLDRYVRTILAEALYNGLEEAIIKGTGKDMPIGMNRQVGDGVTVTGGVYPEKTPVAVTSLDPVAYGQLLAGMSIGNNDKPRVVSSVIMVVNPADYLTKIMPATTIRSADGTYVNNVFPFPTRVIQSIHIPQGKAIMGLPERYFMGIGTGKGGKLEYSDEYRFLEDERVYLIKLYGHGEPLDNNAFVYADISGLTPAIQEVDVRQVKGTVKTKEQA